MRGRGADAEAEVFEETGAEGLRTAVRCGLCGAVDFVRVGGRRVEELAGEWGGIWEGRRRHLIDVAKPKYERAWEWVDRVLEEEGERWREKWCRYFVRRGGGELVGRRTGGRWQVEDGFVKAEDGRCADAREDETDGHEEEEDKLTSGDGRTFQARKNSLGKMAFFAAAMRFKEAAGQDEIKLSLR